MDKSFVTMEQRLCVVCGKTYDTDALLLDQRMRDRFDMKTLTGFGMCNEHQDMADDGWIALIEVSNDPEHGETMKMEDAYRTGKIAHLKRDAFESVFDVPPPSKKVCFVQVGVLDKIKPA